MGPVEVHVRDDAGNLGVIVLEADGFHFHPLDAKAPYASSEQKHNGAHGGKDAQPSH